MATVTIVITDLVEGYNEEINVSFDADPPIDANDVKGDGEKSTLAQLVGYLLLSRVSEIADFAKSEGGAVSMSIREV